MNGRCAVSRAAPDTLLRERGHPGMPAYDAGEELDREAAARIERQNIFTRDAPPRLWVVLGEGCSGRSAAAVVVRGTKDRESDPVPRFDPSAWRAFTEHLKG